MDREILYPNFKEYLSLFYKKYEPHHGNDHIIAFLGSHRGMEDFYLDIGKTEWTAYIYRVDGIDLTQAGGGGNFKIEYKQYSMTLNSIKASMKESKNFLEKSSWPIAAMEADKFLVLK